MQPQNDFGEMEVVGELVMTKEDLGYAVSLSDIAAIFIVGCFDSVFV